MKEILISIKPQWVEKILNGEKRIEGEVWSDLYNYSGLYIISNYGRIISLPRNTTSGKLLTSQISKQGYYVQMLYNNGNKKLCRVNRLVALTFLDNRNNKPVVNHIDGNKLNNYVGNLEWSTVAENTQHSYKNKLQKPSERQKEIARKLCKLKRKPVIVYNKKSFIGVFESVSKASEVLGVSAGCISRVCNKKRKQTNGMFFVWETTAPKSWFYVEEVK